MRNSNGALMGYVVVYSKRSSMCIIYCYIYAHCCELLRQLCTKLRVRNVINFRLRVLCLHLQSVWCDLSHTNLLLVSKNVPYPMNVENTAVRIEDIYILLFFFVDIVCFKLYSRLFGLKFYFYFNS